MNEWIVRNEGRGIWNHPSWGTEQSHKQTPDPPHKPPDHPEKWMSSEEDGDVCMGTKPGHSHKHFASCHTTLQHRPRIFLCHEFRAPVPRSKVSGNPHQAGEMVEYHRERTVMQIRVTSSAQMGTLCSDVPVFKSS